MQLITFSRRRPLLPLLSHQLVLAMRLTALFLIIGFMQVAASGSAQTISYSGKNVSIEKVFAAIKKQTSYVFFYRNDDIEKARKVTVHLKNVTLEQALEYVFKDQPLTYSIVDNTIVVKKKEDKSSASSAEALGQAGPPPPIDIRGRITNEAGEPVVASVIVKGTQIGTTTNADGYFELKNVDDNATLVITGVSIESREVRVGGKSDLAITAITKVTSMNEVVINKGYYTEKQRLSTGNVSTVKAVDIEKQPINNPLLALQGRVAGMEITQNTGLPGSGITVRIRGQNSISQGKDPLYIVDGVPYNSYNLPNLGSILGNSGGVPGLGGTTYGNPLSYINPQDIESVDILKDADATAIYGSRGANGVVLITTKKGKIGQAKVKVDLQSGWGKITRKLDLLNTQQYLQMRKEAFKNDGVANIPASNYDLRLWDSTSYTDWQKELIGRTANYTNINASVSGGATNLEYLLSGTYHKESTVFPGDLSDQKGALHFSLNSTSNNQKFKTIFSTNYLIDNNRLMGQDLTSLATTLAPNAPGLYLSNGGLNWAPNASGFSTWPFGVHPISYTIQKYDSRTSNLISNVILSYQILKKLAVKSSFGYSDLQTNENSGTPISYYDPAFLPSLNNSTRTASYANNNVKSWIVEPNITYTTALGKGELSLLVGSTIQQIKSRGEILNGTGYTSDFVLDDIKSAASVTVLSTVNSIYKYNALFGRVNYNWKDKYLINITGRRDGSSRFGPANQFHNFQAVGLGWLFSREEFIEKQLSFLNYGKIRGSYGTTGSDQIGEYGFLDLYSPTSVGVAYQGVVGLQQNNLFTPDLAWEETKKLEVGIEMGFLNERIFLSTSYYNNRSSNQLTNFRLPSTTGYTSINRNFDAQIRNSGWEFLLNTININSKNLRWSSSINLTINRNKLISIGSDALAVDQRLIGHPLGTTFVYHFLGVDPNTGLYQVADVHGNPVSNPDYSKDATIAVNSNPTFFGGFQNGISFKGFELDFLFQFVKQIGKNYLLGNNPGFFSRGIRNQPTSVLDRWNKIGDNVSVQKYSQNGSTVQSFNNAQASDVAYSDASFIRLKNLSLSWRFGEKMNRNNFLKSAKVFIQGQNLLTLTKYKGMDPETKSNTSLPPLKVLVIGIQTTL